MTKKLFTEKAIQREKVSLERPFQYCIFFLIFFCIHLVQIRIGPIESKTRPYVVLFIFPILLFGLRSYNSPELFRCVRKWFPFFVVCTLYSFVSLLRGVDIKSIAQPFFGFIVIFSFYCVGYVYSFLRKTKFIKILIYTYVPIMILGFVECLGLLFFPVISEFLTTVRSSILTENMSSTRLQLLLSEPSFIATFILLAIYLSQYIQMKWLRYFWLTVLMIFVVMSASLSAAVVSVGGFGLSYLRNRKQVILSVAGILVFSAIVITVSGRELSFSDPSSYIRFLHLDALTHMFYESFGFGMGLGAFVTYFLKYLAGTDLIYVPLEIQNNISGELVPTPYSVLFRILGEMGIFGIVSFGLIFINLFKGRRALKPYYFGILLAGVSALPFGLPYAWILLGLLDRENDCEV